MIEGLSRDATSAWPEPCPRCGASRLIGRETVVAAAPGRGRALALRLRFWRPQGEGGAIVRRTYHCELCGYQWAREAWRQDAQG